MARPTRSARRALMRGAVAALCVSFVSVLVASPATAVSDPALSRARAFVVSQQQSDGGFEVGHFPSFETPDAVLALAELAQTSASWNAAAARTAINAVVSHGKSPLAYADDQAEARDLAPAVAAKYIVLVVEPLGLNPRDFDPSNDSPAPVDLVAAMGKGADLDGRYRTPAFNGLLYIALAHWAIGCAVPSDLVALIESAQQTNGSWNFTGSPAGSGVDVDTTSLAVIALSRAGRSRTDPAIAKALTLLAHLHRANGAWQTTVFPPPADDPNTTSLATLAVAATGQDPATATWRNAAAPTLAGQPYVSPDAWLRSQQKPDGHIAGPGDSFGVTTFATTQTIEALTRSWFTSKPASTTACPLPGGPREKFVRAEFHTLANRTGTNAELQLAARALGPDPTLAAGRLAAAGTTLTTDAYRRGATSELYRRAFNRTPDAGARTFWAARLRTTSRQSVLAELLGSHEFLRAAGGTNPGFLDHLYPAAVGRAADAGGKAFWLARLSSGLSRGSVADALLLSVEGRHAEVRVQYQEVLGRPADAPAVSYWSSRLFSESIEELIARLVASAEYFHRVTA